jgi:hypothetical protein
LAAFTGLLLFNLRKFRNSDKLLKEARRRQTADLPPGNYLFLRCSGDEAAAALSATQFIAWLSAKLSQALELLMRPAFSSHKIIRSVFLGLLGGIISWATLSLLGLGDEEIRRLHAAIEGQFVASLAFFLFFFCVVVVPYLLVFCTLAAFVIFLTQALTSWTFGWRELLDGFFVELAIEPLPFGAHSMAHIDWSTEAPGIEGITHSWTYAHPVAIRYVQDWVKAALQ